MRLTSAQHPPQKKEAKASSIFFAQYSLPFVKTQSSVIVLKGEIPKIKFLALF